MRGIFRGRGNPTTVRAELVEARSFFSAVKKGEGFDRLNPTGFWGPEA
jgi:hypothetical protein